MSAACGSASPTRRSVRDGLCAMLRERRAAPGRTRRLEGVLIEPMYAERHGRELMIGVVRDPVFGPAISFGLGGTLVEVIRDRAVALPPLNAVPGARPDPPHPREPWRCSRCAARRRPTRRPSRTSCCACPRLVCEMPDLGAIDLNPVDRDGRRCGRRGCAHRRACPARRPQLPYRHMAIHPYPSALDPAHRPAGRRSQATIRPIRPEDAAIESDFVHGLSEQSRFLRFMFDAARPVAGDAVAVHADRLRPRAGARRRDRHAGRRAADRRRALHHARRTGRPASSRSSSATSGRARASPGNCSAPDRHRARTGG